MAFITLEDLTGEIELIIFPGVLSAYGHMLTTGAAIAVRGAISVREEEDPKILVNGVINLERNGGKTPMFTEEQKKPRENIPPTSAPVQKLYLKVPSQTSEAFHRVSAFLGIFRGNVPVTFYDEAAKTAFRGVNFGAAVNDFTLTELRELLGDSAVVVK